MARFVVDKRPADHQQHDHTKSQDLSGQKVFCLDLGAGLANTWQQARS